MIELIRPRSSIGNHAIEKHAKHGTVGPCKNPYTICATINPFPSPASSIYNQSERIRFLKICLP